MKKIRPISEARKQLPGHEVVAEIKTSPRATPGKAAKQLLALRKRAAVKGKMKKYPVSENIKEHLYAAEDRL